MGQDSPALATALYTLPDAALSIVGGFAGRGTIRSAGSAGPDVKQVGNAVEGVAKRGVPSTTLSPSKVDWSKSGPQGLLVKDPRDFEVGSRMYASLLDKGLEPDLALTISRELMESGVSAPVLLELKPGDSLYKVMPRNGGPPGDNSPYFMTKEMLDDLPNNTSEAGSILGLPQIPDTFDVYKISAKTNVEVYQSEIAPFSVNGGEYLRSGGGTQTIVTNRDKFAPSTLIGD